MNSSEETLIDRAVQLDGESAEALRVVRGRWFVVMAVAVIAYAVVGALLAVRSGGGVSGIVATIAAMPLFVVAFQAGRLAGRVEAVQRVRTLFRS